MPNKPDFPIRVFYDGSCIVCATEIEHYLRKDHGGRLIAVDISATDFNPGLFGIPLESFMYELHCIDQKGDIYRGIEAFWAIWQAFPSSSWFGLLGSIVTMPVVNPVARLIYKSFARIRKYLPKRHSCSNGSCRIDRKI